MHVRKPMSALALVTATVALIVGVSPVSTTQETTWNSTKSKPLMCGAVQCGTLSAVIKVKAIADPPGHASG